MILLLSADSPSLYSAHYVEPAHRKRYKIPSDMEGKKKYIGKIPLEWFPTVPYRRNISIGIFVNWERHYSDRREEFKTLARTTCSSASPVLANAVDE